MLIIFIVLFLLNFNLILIPNILAKPKIENILNDKKTGIFIRYIYTDENHYKIEWGNREIKRISNDSYEVLGNGVLSLEIYNKYGIVLRQGCGTECWYNIILTFNKKIKEKEIDCGFCYDLKNYLIVYANMDNPVITIENILNGKKQEIFEYDMCQSLNLVLCIDKCKIMNNYLYIKWQGSKWTNKNPDFREKKVKIEIK